MNYSFLVKISAFIILSSLLSNCEFISKKRNIQDYYFPIDNLTDGKVYEYKSVKSDSIAPFYWYFRASRIGGEIIITSEYFNHDFEIQQLTNEVIVKNGVLLQDLFLYEMDTLTGKQIPNRVTVEVGNVFPFEVTDSTGLFLYKIYWQDIYPPQQKYRLIKNRHFMGNETYTFQGKEVDCVKFFTKELLEVEEVGFQELNYNSVELYAKNIGLIYFRKEIDNNIVQEYELADIFDMNELEERFRSTIVEEDNVIKK